MPEIPYEVAQISDNEGLLPKDIAELPQDMEFPEARPYYISFEKYNDKMCQIEKLLMLFVIDILSNPRRW